MGMPNLVFQGKVDVATLEPLGLRRLKSGLYSFRHQDGAIQRWHLGVGRAKAYINAYVETLDHDFGNYTVTFRNRRLEWYGKLEGRTSVAVSGRARHPHYNGSLCWGNMGSSRDFALERNDIETAAGLVNEILRSYYPRDAYGGWWSDHRYEIENSAVHTCIECGRTSEEVTMGQSCGSCQSDLCDQCAVLCMDAEARGSRAWYCRSCLKDSVCIARKEGGYCRYVRCFMHPDRLPSDRRVVGYTTGSGPGERVVRYEFSVEDDDDGWGDNRPNSADLPF